MLCLHRYFIEAVGMDEVGMNKGGGKSGHKTAMDYALDAGMHDEDTVTKKFAVLGYLSEKGEDLRKYLNNERTVRVTSARRVRRAVKSEWIMTLPWGTRMCLVAIGDRRIERRVSHEVLRCKSSLDHDNVCLNYI